MVFVAVRRGLTADPRYWQIAALATLIAYSFAFLDFGAQPVLSVCAIAATVAAQFVCARLWRASFEWRSAMITGLSLSLLLRTNDPTIMALAGVAAITSKFLIRLDGKHIFNPAAFGIVLVLVTTGRAWVSPGQWGASMWVTTMIVMMGGMVLTRAPRLGTAAAFLATHLALLLVRAWWLGDPVAIPLHQMTTGSLLIFAFFMITDPKTTPDSPVGRVLFAVMVAAVCQWLAFFGQVRPALYFGLLSVSPLVPVIDRLIPRERFVWHRSPPLAVEPS